VKVRSFMCFSKSSVGTLKIEVLWELVFGIAREDKMAVSLAPHPILVSVSAIALAISFIVISRPAFRQKSNTVVIRQPGCRFLGAPQPAQPEADTDFDYALLKPGGLRRYQEGQT
jgi:hypothetical protein